MRVPVASLHPFRFPTECYQVRVRGAKDKGLGKIKGGRRSLQTKMQA